MARARGLGRWTIRAAENVSGMNRFGYVAVVISK
jgi:hypothetical protein